MSTTWYDLTELVSYEEQAHEMSKKFKNTLVGIELAGNVFFGWYKDFSNDMYSFKDKYENTIKLSKETSGRVFIPQIEKGYYDINNTCYYISRLANRQWRRGICNDTYTTVPSLFFLNVAPCKDALPFSIIMEEVVELYQKQTDNFLTETKLERCLTEKLVTINRDFAVSLSSQQAQGFSLYYHLIYVGEVELQETNDKFLITIKNPVFKQEVLDTIGEWCNGFTIRFKY